MLGIVAASFWIAGDIALLGNAGSGGSELGGLAAHVGEIKLNVWRWLLCASESRLAWGALLSCLSVPLYIAGCFHFEHMSGNSGGVLRLTLLVAMICGFSYAPMVHLSFYFIGMTLRFAQSAPSELVPGLVALSNHFVGLMMILWWFCAACLFIGFSILTYVIATGKSLYPSWIWLILNPVSLVLLGALAARIMPLRPPVSAEGAGVSVSFLIAFAASTACL